MLGFSFRGICKTKKKYILKYANIFQEIIIEEKAEWLIKSDKSILNWLPNDSNFEEKITIGSKITDDTICNEAKYCDAKLVRDVLKAKVFFMKYLLFLIFFPWEYSRKFLMV